MGERGGQLPERGDPQHVRQLVPLAPSVLLGVSPAGDVDVSDERSAFRAAEWLGRHLVPALAARGPGGVLDLTRHASGEDRADGVQDPERVGIARVRRALADVDVAGPDRYAGGVGPVLGGEAEPCLVHGDDAAVLVERDHVPVERAEDGAPEKVRLEERALGRPQLGHVDRRADVPEERHRRRPAAAPRGPAATGTPRLGGASRYSTVNDRPCVEPVREGAAELRRSSGWTLATQLSPSSWSSRRPVKSSHRWFT